MASRNSAPDLIDVDLFDEPPRRPVKRRVPIVISDDELEVFEVATKLAARTRSFSAESDVKIIEKEPDVIDLVSDDEGVEVYNSSKGKSVQRREPTADVKPPMRGSRRESASVATADIKPVVNASGSSLRKKTIPKGPKPTTTQHTRRVKADEKIEPLEPVDSEDEYEHTGCFNPFRHPTEAPDSLRFEAPAEPAQESVEPTSSKKRRYVDISSGYIPPIPITPTDLYIWDVLREFNVLPHFRSRPRFLSRKRARLGEALNIDHYTTTHDFRRAGGSINKILQHNGRVVICSNTVGGNIAGETDPYNKPGTLISWSKRDPAKILDLERGYEGNLYGTHFSIHCIAYDPISKILASSGADKNVRTWKFDEDDEDLYSESVPYRYEVKSKVTSPHDLAFKPGASILAVGEQRLTVHHDLASANGSLPYDLIDDEKQRNKHVVGAIAWQSANSPLVFALSEPIRKDDHQGHHKAIDIERCRTSFKFDAPEAGDALCVDPTGDTVALVTNSGSESFLRIYDVARHQGQAIQARLLEPFETDDHEVNSMAFSSDGIYLAIGRDDNRTHVYDSRMLERGVLFDFRHADMPFSVKEQNFFGVVGVEWVENRSTRLGLVTGGNDGCIRLWDPLRAKDEGVILAQVDSDVASFSLGDPFKGEHGLVVGDSDGGVYIMDGHANM
ncbi:WD40-repeat-containing domain protein [Mycena epipterygia]|nr:WD40-repeat-containing domain protein [Mycena epipterygia]